MRAVLACILIMAAMLVSTVSASLDAMPTRLEFARFTCGDLLGLDAERQERALVYLIGVMDGRPPSAT